MLQTLPHDLEQLVVRKRLPERGHSLKRIACSRDSHDPQVRVSSPRSRDQRFAGHARHSAVRHEQRRLDRGEQIGGLLPIRGIEDHVTGFGENAGDERTNTVVVIDDEDYRGAGHDATPTEVDCTAKGSATIITEGDIAQCRHCRYDSDTPPETTIRRPLS